VSTKTVSVASVTVVRHSQDSNGKALLAQALQNINLTSLYNMQNCEEMVASFYSTVTSLLNYYLPLSPSNDTQLTIHGSLTSFDASSDVVNMH